VVKQVRIQVTIVLGILQRGVRIIESKFMYRNNSLLSIRLSSLEKSIPNQMAAQPDFIHNHMKRILSDWRCIPLEMLLDLNNKSRKLKRCTEKIEVIIFWQDKYSMPHFPFFDLEIWERKGEFEEQCKSLWTALSKLSFILNIWD